jgi:CPA2 family monovalent cation:H+ antiporter-2
MIPVLASMTSHDLVGSFATAVTGAALVYLIFKRLGWPVIFGYLLAGMLMGPHLLSRSLVSDVDAVNELSEFGVVFLLFFIGMEFDLRRLRSVMGPAALALLAQSVGMFLIARGFSDALGWDSLYTLFLASLLAISSSMVAVGVMREQKKLNLPHAQLAIGVLILEDILAVILLVVLSGLGVTREFEWEQVWLVTSLMGLFVIFAYLVGRIAVASFMERIRATAGAEEYAMLSVGLALGLSLLAMHLGFSLALGAFVAGAIFSQTRDVDRVEETTRSLHDIFSAVFFVSIGMLLDPSLILSDWKTVFLLSGAVILGKVITVWAGLFLGGQPSQSSFRAAVAKSQIGEFSFVIAALGNQLGVTSDRFTAIAFGTAFITILATPFLANHSLGAYNWMWKHTPSNWIRIAEAYRKFLESIVILLGGWEALKLIKGPLLRMIAYVCVTWGLLIAAAATCTQMQWEQTTIALIVWAAVALLISPLLLAAVRNANETILILTRAIWKLSGSGEQHPHAKSLFSYITLALFLFVIGSSYVSVASAYLPRGAALILLAVLTGLLGLIFWQQIAQLNRRIEHIFEESYVGNEELEARRKKAMLKEMSERYPWPVSIREFQIPPNSGLCGQTILDLDLRHTSGVTIIALARNDFRVFDPAPTTSLFPKDTLVVLGEEDQLQAAFQRLTELSSEQTTKQEKKRIFQLRQIVVDSESGLDGNTLAGADLRRKQGVNVIGIQRGATRITAPGGSEMLRAGDILYVVD